MSEEEQTLHLIEARQLQQLVLDEREYVRL